MCQNVIISEIFNMPTDSYIWSVFDSYIIFSFSDSIWIQESAKYNKGMVDDRCCVYQNLDNLNSDKTENYLKIKLCLETQTNILFFWNKEIIGPLYQ